MIDCSCLGTSESLYRVIRLRNLSNFLTEINEASTYCHVKIEVKVIRRIKI